ncbi:MAG: 50S ribosomal protein L11 methyltransferase [Anaerolineaceae bacterium]|nr:50S ribosomal protein L11 methyltransferase [Anaerolineaceae bacterium]
MDEPQISWLEVSVSCDGELAESVAEVISRYVTQGVVTETNVRYDETEEIPMPYGLIKVYGYLLNDETVEEKRKQIEQGLWYLNMIQPVPEPQYQIIHNQDWMESWKERYHPIQVGERLLVLPAWLENPYPERIAVKIDPSMAFGTGTHPTTQLCMQMAESVIKPGDTVIDVGCGSGILSIAAAKLGASHILAVDTDHPSVVSTFKNAKANEVEGKIEIGEGSVTEILHNNFSIQSAPVVLVNILAPIIIRLFDDGLGELVNPGGKLVLSGILDKQAGQVREAAEKQGFTFLEQININDWISMILEK